MPRKLLYLLVRTDVSVAVQGVQLAHVAAVIGAIYPNMDWTQMTFKVLAVEDESELLKIMRSVSKLTEQWQVFKEPDMKGRIVAAAVLSTLELFGNLKLWNPLAQLEQKLRDTESALYEERMGEDL